MNFSAQDLLNVGAQAMQQARYSDAISPLERFCKETPSRRSKAFFQAQMWLVQAYEKTGQDLHAIALCEQLVKSDIPQVQQWGQKALAHLMQDQATAQPQADQAIPNPSSRNPDENAIAPAAEDNSIHAAASSATARPPFLEPGDPLTPEAAADYFASGRRAMQKGQYDEAVIAFEQFVRGADPAYSNYGWAWSSLGKAYRGNDQTEQALALCQHLQTSDQENLRTWAKDFIKTLDLPKDAIPSAEMPPPLPSATLAAESASSGEITVARPSPTATFQQRQLRGKPQGKDLSPQILSALAHGSISLLASLIILMLFMDSLAANVLGLLRYAVPLIILLKAEHGVVEANAKEALNYVITVLIMSVASVVIVLMMIPLIVVALPLVILMMTALIVYGLALSIWPIIATIACARDDQRVFLYPNWLIMHFL